MKKNEMRRVRVTYCDVCGKEIPASVGMVVFNKGSADEQHACKEWNEAERLICSAALAKKLPSAPAWECGPGTQQFMPA